MTVTLSRLVLLVIRYIFWSKLAAILVVKRDKIKWFKQTNKSVKSIGILSPCSSSGYKLL